MKKEQMKQQKQIIRKELGKCKKKKIINTSKY